MSDSLSQLRSSQEQLRERLRRRRQQQQQPSGDTTGGTDNTSKSIATGASKTGVHTTLSRASGSSSQSLLKDQIIDAIARHLLHGEDGHAMSLPRPANDILHQALKAQGIPSTNIAGAGWSNADACFRYLLTRYPGSVTLRIDPQSQTREVLVRSVNKGKFPAQSQSDDRMQVDTDNSHGRDSAKGKRVQGENTSDNERASKRAKTAPAGDAMTLTLTDGIKVDSTLLGELLAPSVKEREKGAVNTQIADLLTMQTASEKASQAKFKTQGGTRLREFCPRLTKKDCMKATGDRKPCALVHFRRIILKHTVLRRGDCPYLDACRNLHRCQFVHYIQDDDTGGGKGKGKGKGGVDLPRAHPPQWINCDVRDIDFTALGKFSVVMADPPWDIRMELPYGTMADQEMRNMPIQTLQDNGYIFLWVTGRAMELARECLVLWGYDRVDELIWVKTNQLQCLKRSGRTGHWLNHTKEHCLIGAKGDVSHFNSQIDTDVIVAEVRETSRKPDEVYGIIERLAPGMRKLEIFGRVHNRQPGWVTIGNQLPGVTLYEKDMLDRVNRSMGTDYELSPLPKGWGKEVTDVQPGKVKPAQAKPGKAKTRQGESGQGETSQT